MKESSLASVLETQDTALLESVITHASGPSGSLPITPEMLLEWPSGNLFGLSQNAGMGWDPSALSGAEVLLLSTHGGVRAINRSVPRLVDALPNGPQNYPTVQVFLAGGVPEVMLHLRRAGLLDLRVTMLISTCAEICGYVRWVCFMGLFFGMGIFFSAMVSVRCC